MKILQLYKIYRKKLSFVLALIIIENVAWILEPTVFGRLIDEFILKASGSPMKLSALNFVPLIFWIGLYFINSTSGSARRYFEPRIFQNIFADIVVSFSKKANILDLDTSVTVGRANLSQEYIHFLQYRIPEMLEQVIAISGAVIALTLYDWRISTTCLMVIVPLIIIGQIYSRRVAGLQKVLHDNYENVVDSHLTKKPSVIRSIYKSMAAIQSSIGKYNAMNFGLMRLSLLIVFLSVLYISIDMDNFTTGDIYSIVSYLWTFITSSEYLPDLMESRASLNDISERINIDESIVNTSD